MCILLVVIKRRKYVNVIIVGTKPCCVFINVTVKYNIITTVWWNYVLNFSLIMILSVMLIMFYYCFVKRKAVRVFLIYDLHLLATLHCRIWVHQTYYFSTYLKKWVCFIRCWIYVGLFFYSSHFTRSIKFSVRHKNNKKTDPCTSGSVWDRTWYKTGSWILNQSPHYTTLQIECRYPQYKTDSTFLKK